MNLRQNEKFLKELYQKACLPCVLAILSGNINILVDGILVGQCIGVEGLAAINLCLPVYLIQCIAGSFLVSGTAICASKAIGKRDKSTANRLYSIGVESCLAASLLLTVVGMLCLNLIADFFATDIGMQVQVKAYLLATILGTFPKIMIYVPFWFLRLEGKNKTVTSMMVIMGAENILLDLLLLYVFHMGVFGAGLASLLATLSACLFGFYRLERGQGNLHFRWVHLSDKKMWMEISKAGSPAAMNNCFGTLRILVINAVLLNYGGNMWVAAFTAVNCIAAFAEAVTGGIPQAASSMLGVYIGERDTDSVRLLMEIEAKTGFFCVSVFSLLIIAGADGIAWLYGLPISLREAMVMLSVGMVFGLWNSMLTTYYNVSDHIFWSNLIIGLRVLVCPTLCLVICAGTGMNLWLFLAAGEGMTTLCWWGISGVYHKRHLANSRYLMMDRTLDESGRVLNFSVQGENEQICEASEKITQFCEECGLEPKQMMRISLAMEEMMTVIVMRNPKLEISFDLRAFCLQSETGICIRYNGRQFDPFSDITEDEDTYLSIQMLTALMKQQIYQWTLGINMLMIVV